MNQNSSSGITTTGNVKNISKKEYGIYLTAENCKARILFYGDAIIRIEICTPFQQFEDFSYAVTASPQKINYSLKEKRNEILVTTSKILLRISLSPLHFIFSDSEGNILNEDDKSFGTSWIGDTVTTYKKLQPGEKFIGLGEKTGNVNKRGHAYINWNTDAFEYGAETDPLYVSTPFYLGLHKKNIYGIFLDNTYKTTFNFGASNTRFSSFSAEGGNMNYYFLHGKNIAEIVFNYATLTGFIEMPALWSLGYQQSRYSYYPEHEVLTLAQNFRKRKIPCDAIYFDIHFMNDYKIFTWNKKRFPDAKKLIDNLYANGFHTAVIIDPGIKADKKYAVYASGNKKNIFLKYTDNTNYTANVWPGACCFPDFTSAKARKWWTDELKNYCADGIEGFWNDMNEISSWGQNTPDNILFNYEGKITTHKKAKNIYGLQMARATCEGAKKQNKNKRPFVLSRSAFSGIQRYAAVWTGDTVSNDEHLLLGCRMLSNMGLAGIIQCGNDIGGFVGDASANLFTRWMSVAAFQPFMRSHTMINSRDAEPWTFGEEAEEICRNYIALRYKLLPYIYALFYEASKTAMPVMRSLCLYHPFDEKIYATQYQNQFYLGENILIAPVASEKEFVKVYFPQNNFYDVFTDAVFQKNTEINIDAPKEKLPVFIKAGAIIPMQNVIQSTSEMPENILHLHLYKGDTVTSFTWYEDDGITYDYKNGKYSVRKIELDSKNNKLTLYKAEGNFISKFKTLRMYFHGFGKINSVSAKSKKCKIKKQDHHFIEPVSGFDPFVNNSVDYCIKELMYAEMEFSIGEICIELL